MYRWRGQGPWERLDGGLPEPLDAMPYALVATDGGLYAGLSDGRVYVSEDGGDTWSRLSIEGDAVSRIVALTYASR